MSIQTINPPEHRLSSFPEYFIDGLD